MLRKGAWGGAVLASLTLLGTAQSGDDPRYAPTGADVGRSSFQRWGGPVDTPKPAAKPKADKEPKPDDGAAARRAQEEADLLRRLAVVDRLRQIALDSNDSDLEKQAADLEVRATEAYRHRTAKLIIVKSSKSDKGEQK